MNWEALGAIGLMAVIVVGAVGGVVVGLNYLTTGNPFEFPTTKQNSPCGEGIHVTHNGQPIANLAIKQPGQGTYTWGSTNQTGYMIMSICSPTAAIITFQASDYAFQLQPHQIIEASL